MFLPYLTLAAMAIHSGDFDYQSNPFAWDDQITQILGADYPYFSSIGAWMRSVWVSDVRVGVQARVCTCA